MWTSQKITGKELKCTEKKRDKKHEILLNRQKEYTQAELLQLRIRHRFDLTQRCINTIKIIIVWEKNEEHRFREGRERDRETEKHEDCY